MELNMPELFDQNPPVSVASPPLQPTHTHTKPNWQNCIPAGLHLFKCIFHSTKRQFSDVLISEDL